MVTPESQKKKKNHSKSVLIIGLLTLLTVGSWVIFDVYRALVKTTVPHVVQQQIQPLDSKLDPDVMTDLQSRKSFTDQELNSVHPNPNLIVSPTASRSGIVRVTPTPSQVVSSTSSAKLMDEIESTQSARGSL